MIMEILLIVISFIILVGGIVGCFLPMLPGPPLAYAGLLLMHFSTEIVGYNHILAAMSYVLRNAVHHGVVPIPYAYPHSSANAIFREEMGKMQQTDLLSPKSYYRYIGKAVEYPERYKMHKSGVFLRESVLDIAQVENMYTTPRAFNYHMSRKSGEEWEKEQEKDRLETGPVRLETIEYGIRDQPLEKMLIYESGKADYRRPTDLDVCNLIDKTILPRYGKPSVYLLTEKEKQMIAENLYRQYHITESQIRRCLVM